jgi:hypothetical protein
MPHKDPEARRRYLLANKERIAARGRAYRLANHDKLREYAKAHEAAYKDRRREIDAKPENKARRRAYAKQWQHDNPDKIAERNAQIKPKRADTEPTQIRNRVLMAGRPKPDICELCGRPPGRKGLMYDHCHQRGHFRGWICTPCNLALGYVQDDVKILLKMIAYLERNRTNTAPQLVLSGI